MSYLVLVNAKSGTVRDRGRAGVKAEIEAGFAAGGADAEVHVIHPRDLEDRIAAALDSDPPPKTIVVAGGDGSLSSAAGLLAGKPAALGIMPLGTMNLLARALGVPLDPAQAIATLLRSKPVRIDLLDINGRYVLLHASIGLQPKVIQSRELLPYKTRLMRLTNGLIAWIRATRRLRPVRISGKTESGIFERSASAVLISNNVLPEGIGEMPVSHDLTNGMIAVYVCTSGRRSNLVRLALASSLGIWRQSDLVEEFVARRLDIDSGKPKLLLSVDGELTRLKTPLKCRVKRRCLAVLMPRQGAGGRDGYAEDAAG